MDGVRFLSRDGHLYFFVRFHHWAPGADASLLPVYNQQVGPHTGAPGEGLVPGGQQLCVTDHPVTTAGEAQPAAVADGWRRVSKE